MPYFYYLQIKKYKYTGIGNIKSINDVPPQWRQATQKLLDADIAAGK